MANYKHADLIKNMSDDELVDLLAFASEEFDRRNSEPITFDKNTEEYLDMLLGELPNSSSGSSSMH